ncbi:hypothetical protein CSB37_02540 [bacterium DOLZORAL124_38_8]|nr:MAG: hypothetical protein CSB37_02540 [bacterium DOLZORAL124_38_8]
MDKQKVEKEIFNFLNLVKKFEKDESFSDKVSVKFGELEKYISKLGKKQYLKNPINGVSCSIYEAIYQGELLWGTEIFSYVIKDLNYILGKLKGMGETDFKDLFSLDKKEVIEKEKKIIVEKKGFFYYSNPLFWLYFIYNQASIFVRKNRVLSGVIGTIILGLIINYFYAILEPYLPFLPTKQ